MNGPKHIPKPTTPMPKQEQVAQVPEKAVVPSSATAMSVGGPVALETATPSEDLLKVFAPKDPLMTASDQLHGQLAEMINYMDNQTLKDLLFGFTVEDVHRDLMAYQEAKTGGDLDAVVKLAGRHADHLDAWTGLTDDRSMAEAEFGFTNEDIARAVQNYRHALGVPKTTEEIRAWLKNVMIPSVLDGDPQSMTGDEVEAIWNKRWKGLVEKAETLNPTPEEIKDAQSRASRIRDHTKTWNLTPAQLVLYIQPIKAMAEKLMRDCDKRMPKPSAAVREATEEADGVLRELHAEWSTTGFDAYSRHAHEIRAVLRHTGLLEWPKGHERPTPQEVVEDEHLQAKARLLKRIQDAGDQGLVSSKEFLVEVASMLTPARDADNGSLGPERLTENHRKS